MSAPPRDGRLGRALRRHPEAVPLAAVVAAWVALVWLHGGPGHAHDHHVHGAPHDAMAPGAWLGMWLLMCVAMMVPAIVPAIRHVAVNSLRRRAGRSVAILLGTYLVGWFAFGLLALAVVGLLHTLALPDGVPLGAAIAVALVWPVLPVQERLRWACHRTVPLPPTGWRSVRGCTHFGARQAWACIGICWPLMLVMALQMEAGMAWMVALSALVIGWKYLPRRYRPMLRAR